MMALALVATACWSISGSQITVGDFARAMPGLSPVDPSAVVARAPLPGVVRVFPPAELERLLKPFDPSVIAPRDGICFDRPVAPLSETAVIEAMRTALVAGSKIEVVELSRFPAPPGEIVFPREWLGSAPVALWRGYVRYADNGRFQIWARVKVLVPVVRIVSLEVLQPGKPIRLSQVKRETVEDTPTGRVTPLVVENVEGFIPRRTIPAGSPVWADSIDPPMEISKGDQVVVNVHSGLAALTLDAQAVTSGRRGEAISLKNPTSGKIFRAHVDGVKAASVQVDPVK